MIKIFAGFALFHKKGIFFPVSSKYKLVHRRLYADKHQKTLSTLVIGPTSITV